ncbi:hypothetical protein [Thomasclavelia cocleata]|uniref:hypothetical protein n=1 Tax=Thomasclavelia cocleata TaxID=69824 RepID=UPI00242B1435|nr:hypothetical protein [Thomasclavelia cocleata]
MELPNELKRYSDRNVIAEEWINIFNDTVNFINNIYVSRVFTNEQFNKLESYSYDLCRFQNAIIDINGLDDNFKEYTEAQTWLISALHNVFLQHDKLMEHDEMSPASLEFFKEMINELQKIIKES